MTKRAHGEGSIDTRAEDTHRLRYRVGGKRFTKTVQGTLADARKELRRLVRSGDTGEHVAPDRVTLKEWVDQWIALLERPSDNGERRRGLVNARTLERYAELLRGHVVPTLGHRPLQQIQPTEIDKLYVKLEKSLAVRTVHHVHVVLNSCLKAAVRKRALSSNPAESAEAPVVGGETCGRVLDDDELKTLLGGFRPSSLFPIVATAAFTGARRNEILALRWCDLDVTAKTLRIARAVEQTKKFGVHFKEPKSARHIRTITIDDELLAILTAEREKYLRLIAGVPQGAPVDLSMIRLPDDALIFPSPPAGPKAALNVPRQPRGFTKGFIRRAASLGFPGLRLHDLRGTHETLLLDRGVPVHVVAARCGHDPAVLLRIYAQRTRKADTSAAAVIGVLSKAMLAR